MTLSCPFCDRIDDDSVSLWYHILGTTRKEDMVDYIIRKEKEDKKIKERIEQRIKELESKPIIAEAKPWSAYADWAARIKELKALLK